MQKHGGISDFKVVSDGIIDGVIRQAMEKGVRFGSIQIVDSVQTVANVNNKPKKEKDRIRQEKGLPSADPHATVVNKGSFRQASRKRLVPAWG